MTLRISNATVNETGQYRCYYQGLRAEEGKTSAGVYVFVHGASRPPTVTPYVIDRKYAVKPNESITPLGFQNCGGSASATFSTATQT